MNIDRRIIKSAVDYQDKEETMLSNVAVPMVEVIQTMDKHPFVKWIDKQSYFKVAKSKIEQQRIVINSTACSRENEFRAQFALEGLLAFTIMATKKITKDLLDQVVVHKTERQEAIALLEKVYTRFTDGKLYFGNGVLQQLLIIVVGRLLRNPGHSPFSSKKDHELLLRHTFIKHFMQGLLRIYSNMTNALVVDVTLNIVDAIFSTTDRSELQKLIKEIKSVIDDENKLLEKSVYELYMNE